MSIKEGFLAFLLLLWASPWLLLIVDGVALFLTGGALTSVPWTNVRVAVALATPVIVGFVAAGVGG